MAILLVLLYHGGRYETAQPIQKALRMVTGISFGWSGVDLFFVLSGFLITTILLETRSSPDYFSAFYARRILRIFPLYWAAVFVTFFLGLPLAHTLGFAKETSVSESLWYWTYLSNWRSGAGTDVAPLTHFWSLAIEEQFYLIWPWAVHRLPEPRLRRACLGIVCAVFLLRAACAWDLDNRAIYRFTVFRMDALAFGALVALAVRNRESAGWLRRRHRAVMASGLMLVGVATILAASPRPYTPWMATIGYAAWGAFYSCLVFYAVDRTGDRGIFPGALRQPGLQSMGKYSYGIYVLHYPLLLLIHAAMHQLAAVTGWGYNIGLAWFSIVLTTAGSYACARLSWLWLEEPFLRLKRRFPYRLSS